MEVNPCILSGSVTLAIGVYAVFGSIYPTLNWWLHPDSNRNLVIRMLFIYYLFFISMYGCSAQNLRGCWWIWSVCLLLCYFYLSQVTDSRYASPDQDQWSGHLQSEGLFLYTTILIFLTRFGNDRRWSFSSIFLRVVDLLYLFYPIMSLCFVKYEHASTLTMYSHFFAFGL